MLVVIYLLLVSASIALAYLMKYRFEQAIPVACLAMIAILYMCGLAKILVLGVYIIIALGIAATVFLITIAFKRSVKRSYWFDKVFTPGFAVFSLFYILICWMHRGRLLNEWMEFSHWGLVVKNMYIFDAFGNIPEATTMYRGYPPASSLFQYLWAKVYGVFQEPNLYRSMNILILSLVIPIFKKISWKQTHLIAWIVVIVFILPMTFFSTIYINLCVDALLGIMLAYILYIYFTTDHWTMPAVINLALAMFVLPLIKASGFGLAIIASLIIIFDIFAYRRKQTDLKTRFKTNHNNYTLALVSFITPFIANYSWKIYLSQTNTVETWDKISQFSFSTVLAFFKHEGEMYQYQTLKNFVEALLKTPLTSANYDLSYVLWILIFIVLALPIIHLCKKEYSPKRMIIYFAGISLGGMIYTMSVAILYMFIFTQREALLLASYERYMNPYPLACLLLLTYFFIDGMSENETLRCLNKKWKQSVCLLLVATLLCSLVSYKSIKTTFSRSEINRTQIARDNRIKINRIIPMLDTNIDTIYYINQNTTKYEWLVAQYIMTPVKFYGGGSDVLAFGGSIGTPYAEDDIWTENITCDEWVERLKNHCTYVYLANIDDKFIAEFGSAFENPSEISNDSFFRVEKGTEETILKYVDISSVQ